jgi:hypothetical protein
MGISHKKTEHYWRFVDDSRCPYKKAAKLVSGIWWLDIRGTLFGVPPGRYWVQWGLGLTNSSSVVRTQFRVALFSNDEVKCCRHFFFVFCFSIKTRGSSTS